MIKPSCIREMETEKGTLYQIEKWICPICKQGKSTLYIDDEWCHGDSYGSRYGGGLEPLEGCTECLMTANEEKQ